MPSVHDAGPVRALQADTLHEDLPLFLFCAIPLAITIIENLFRRHGEFGKLNRHFDSRNIFLSKKYYDPIWVRSLSLPEFTVTSKQFITNGETQRIEMRLHDGKLYIMSHESGSIVGGVLVLDPLPDSAIYGTQGLSSSDGVNFTLTLGEQDYSAWTQADTDALVAALKAETGAAQVNVTIQEGSVKAVCDFVLSSSASDQATKDALVAKIDTVTKVNTILAASSSVKLQTAATQNNSSTVPTIQTVTAKPELLSTSVVGDNLVFEILGAYNAIQWKTGGNWVTLPSPFATSLFGGLEGTHDIEFRLISPDSSVLGIPATISVSFPAQFAYYITGVTTVNGSQEFDNSAYQSGTLSLVDALFGFRGLNAGDHTFPYTPAGVTKSMDMSQFYTSSDWKMTVACDFTPASLGYGANSGATYAFGDPAGTPDNIVRPIISMGNHHQCVWRFQFQYTELTFKSYGGNVAIGWNYADMAGMEGDTFRFYWSYDNSTRITKIRIHNVTKDTILPMQYNNKGVRTDHVVVDNGNGNPGGWGTIEYKWASSTPLHSATYPFDGTGTLDFSGKTADLANHQLFFGFFENDDQHPDHRPIGSTNGWPQGAYTHPPRTHQRVAVGTWDHILVHNNIIEFEDLPF